MCHAIAARSERESFLRRRRLPSADDRGRADARQVDGHRMRRRRSPNRKSHDLQIRRLSAASSCNIPTTDGRIVDYTDVIASRTRRRRAGRRRDRSARPHADQTARRIRRRTSPSARPSASACRWASAGRTRRSCRPRPNTPAKCPAGSSASPKIRTATPRIAWRCKPASSTSAAKRPRATSAPPRCCWRSWPSMYAVYHGPEGLKRIAQRVHALTRLLATALRTARPRRRAEHRSSTRSRATVESAAAQTIVIARPSQMRINFRDFDDGTHRHFARRNDNRR